VEEKVSKLIEPRTVARPIGVSAIDRRAGNLEGRVERAMPELVKNAFDDPSWRSNPRMPLIPKWSSFWKAYEGEAWQSWRCF